MADGAFEGSYHLNSDPCPSEQFGDTRCPRDSVVDHQFPVRAPIDERGRHTRHARPEPSDLIMELDGVGPGKPTGREVECPRVAQQEAFDGRKALSDFIMFIYEASSVTASTGNGRSSGGSFVYSVR